MPALNRVERDPAASWEIDVDSYDDRLEDLLALCERVRRTLPGTGSDTLVTKTVLGVFGAVPAFDRYFRLGFGTPTYSRRALESVGAFYRRHCDQIDGLPKIATLDFQTGESTYRLYPAAKTFDMIFFERGRQLESAHVAGGRPVSFE